MHICAICIALIAWARARAICFARIMCTPFIIIYLRYAHNLIASADRGINRCRPGPCATILLCTCAYRTYNCRSSLALQLVASINVKMAHSTVCSASASQSSHMPVTSRPIAETPHQPLCFQFPKRPFGKKKIVYRSFQPSWFSSCAWLDYDETTDTVLCKLCAKGR